MALEAFKLLIVGEVAFAGIYLVVVFFDKLDDFVEYRASAVDVAAYMIFKIPSIFLEVAPAAVLLASTMTIALLSKHNELLAMKTSGMSLLDISKPLLFMAALVSAMMFFAQEFIAPGANLKTKETYRTKIERKQPLGSSVLTDVWYRASDSSIWSVKYVDSSTSSLKGATIYLFGRDYWLNGRIDAEQALWSGDGWIFKKGVARQFDTGGSFSEEFFDERFFASNVKPGELREIQKDPSDMSLGELSRYRKKLRRHGFDDKNYLVELHFKISRSAIPLLMALIAIPFAARRAIKGGLAISFGFTVAVSFIYYVLMSLGLALGKGGHLPPVLAAWEANIIFASAFIYLLVGIRR